MFILTQIKDTVPIFPISFSVETHVAITDSLNKKYSSKLLHEIGLCISVYDLLTVSDGKVRWGDGAVWYHVTFNLLVFRPFVGEVLVGKVKSSTKDAVRISVGFFDDIYIPASNLPNRHAFDPDENLHFWLPPTGEEEEEEEEEAEPTASTSQLFDSTLTNGNTNGVEFSDVEDEEHNKANGLEKGKGKQRDFARETREKEEKELDKILASDKASRLYLDPSELIRFRILNTPFIEHEPGPPSTRSHVVNGVLVPKEVPEDQESVAEWTLEGTIGEQGLGLLSWWEGAEEEVGYEEEYNGMEE